MAHPKGMRVWTRPVAEGAQAHIYSDDSQIVLQLRQAIATEDDILTPSFKVAITLRASDALALASELLNASGRVVAARESQITGEAVEARVAHMEENDGDGGRNEQAR